MDQSDLNSMISVNSSWFHYCPQCHPSWTFPDPCDWVGITCILASTGKTKVSSISLESGLDPGLNIPPELGDLTSLSSLFLSGNGLSGTVPSSLNSLRDLKNLNLSFNSFIGRFDFPQPFSSCDISNNTFECNFNPFCLWDGPTCQCLVNNVSENDFPIPFSLDPLFPDLYTPECVSKSYNNQLFCFTSETNGTFVFTTCGGEGDSFLVAYSECSSCPMTSQMSPITCDIGACGSQSAIYLDMISGQEVMIQLGTWNPIGQASGQLSLLPPGYSCPIIPVNQSSFPLQVQLNSSLPTFPSSCEQSQVSLFCFKASESGIHTFSTCDSRGDTTLGLYDSCSRCPIKNPYLHFHLACQDDDSCGLGESVSIYLQAGEEISISLGTPFPNETASAILDLTIGSTSTDPSANPNQCPAIEIGPFEFPILFDLSPDFPDGPFCGNRSQSHNFAFFCFTPWVTGLHVIDTCNSSGYLDTTLAVTRNCSNCPPDQEGNVLNCNDDSSWCHILESMVEVNLTAGESVLIQVGTFAADERGTARLNLWVPFAFSSTTMSSTPTPTTTTSLMTTVVESDSTLLFSHSASTNFLSSVSTSISVSIKSSPKSSFTTSASTSFDTTLSPVSSQSSHRIPSSTTATISQSSFSTLFSASIQNCSGLFILLLLCLDLLCY